MGYSEGLWTPEATTLNQAKYNNYEYICRKLQLKPGMTVLEVGAGWGYMPIYMATRYHIDVTVYNPVRCQNDYMRERFRRYGLSEKIRLVEGDHRDIVREGSRSTVSSLSASTNTPATGSGNIDCGPSRSPPC